MTRKTYRVRPGVGWVNGARVPASGKVNLTETEARFDLDHGRIDYAPAKSKTVERGEAETDGGN
ncbi:hypothetical protein FHS76_003511 [Ochrobactrum daejeonense]|uniref:Uncharacterized protein n=1 Tax=Brucella daejeonensis TaxID=659015 RepID=A0A7W9EMM9_9HYPH|nr:hypothetical protein [Brucella daejeonensis]MBB5703604.1 hypothetical protein [Brucella daejeonensis]